MGRWRGLFALGSVLMGADVRWIKGGEVLDAWLTHPQLLPAGRELVYMVGKHGRVRFYAPGRNLGGSGLRQRGPQFGSIVAATCWAYWHRWMHADGDLAGAHACTVEQWNNTYRKGTDDLLVHVGCSCSECPGAANAAQAPLPPALLEPSAAVPG